MPPYLRLVWTAPPRGRPRTRRSGPRPTPTQLEWLRRGLDRAGGNLPIFDTQGQQISDRTVKSCVDRGWAERKDKLTRDWQLCQLTAAGRRMLEAE